MNNSTNCSCDSDMSLTEHNEIKIADGIKTYYPPIICVIGLSGNILAVAVLSRAKNRRSTTGVMLLALAVTDIIVLLTSVLLAWIEFVFEEYIRNLSSAGCKILTFLTYFSLQLSAWILVMITSERIFSVIVPHRVKKLITRKRVLISLVSLILGLAGLNCHLLYGLQVAYNTVFNKTVCKVASAHEHFMFKVWPWIDFSVSFAFPGLVFLIGNIVIITRLKSSSRRSSAMTSTNGDGSQSNRERSKKIKHINYFSVMTVILNFAFLILVAPFSIFAIGQPYWFPIAEMTVKRHAQLILISTILLMLLYTNNAINFIIYMLGGSKLRKDFLSLCFRRRKKHVYCSERTASSRASHSTQSAVAGSQHSVSSPQNSLS